MNNVVDNLIVQAKKHECVPLAERICHLVHLLRALFTEVSHYIDHALGRMNFDQRENGSLLCRYLQQSFALLDPEHSRCVSFTTTCDVS